MACPIYTCPWGGAAYTPLEYESEVPEEQEACMEEIAEHQGPKPW